MSKLKFNKNTQEYCDVVVVFKFDKNYNGKLSNEYFTTIRKKNMGVEIGDKVKIELLKTERFDAKVIEVRKLALSQIPSLITYLDTGLDKSDFTKLIQSKYKGNVDRGHLFVYLLKRNGLKLFKD